MTPRSDTHQILTAISALGADVAVLKTNSARNRADISELRADVSALRDSVNKAKGGWLALLGAGGAAGGLGGLVVRALERG